MTDHLHRDLERVKQNVLAMGGLAEEALGTARSAFETRDPAHVEGLRSIEVRIDSLQMQIDDEILKCLALHQPVAGDLRFVTAAMKIVNDLERVGDLATTIGKRLLEVLECPPVGHLVDFGSMMDKAAEMLNQSLDAFVRLDSALARRVIELDDWIDDQHRKHFEQVVSAMKADPHVIDLGVALLSISRCIERIADLSTNIAEDVVFVAEATDIRHPRLSAPMG
jgi:phosphate transport system protein